MLSLVTAAALAQPQLNIACNQRYQVHGDAPAKTIGQACLNGTPALGGALSVAFDGVTSQIFDDANGIPKTLEFECTYKRTLPGGITDFVTKDGNANYWNGGFIVGELTSYRYGPCYDQCREGNPIGVTSGEKTQRSTDWISPREPRFLFERNYSSGEVNLLSDGGLGNGWASNFYTILYQNGIADLTYARRPTVFYHFEKNGSNWDPDETDHQYSVTATTSGLFGPFEVSDGTGRKELYVDTRLNTVTFADGYQQTLTYDTSFDLETITDNRGNRAELTRDNDDNIIRIDIDTNYDSITFAADVRIAYTYRFNTAYDEFLLASATTTDLQSSAVLNTESYTYTAEDPTALSSFPTAIAKLATISDGRLNASGQPFNYSTFTYDDGVAVATEHFGGADRYSFDRSSTPLTVTNPLGKSTEYTFADVENKPRVTNIDGVATPFCLATTKSLDYTPNAGAPDGYVYERTERNGSKTTYNRDSRGLVLTKTEDATGTSPRVTTYTWTSSLRLPLSRTTTQMTEDFTYDADGLLTAYSQTDVLVGSPSNGEVRTWTYNYTTLASGLKVLTSVDGPGLVVDGVTDVTTYTYNADGTVATMTDPNGLTTTYASYDKFGNATRIVLPDGVAWEMEYDAKGQLTEVIENADASSINRTTFTYDVVGQMTSFDTASGETWTMTYDEARRLTQMENSTGEIMTFTHDLAGNVLSTEYFNTSSASTFLESAAYDELSRIRQILGSQSQTTTFTHDVEDNVATVTDPQTNVTTNSYDALNRLTQVVDRAAGTTTMDYDDADQMTDFTDQRQIDTDFTYNGFGEVVQEVSADRGTMSYTYNRRGLVSSMTDARGIVSNYVYDNGGRITARNFPTASSENQSFQYDFSTSVNQGEGKIDRIIDESGRTFRRYRDGGYVSLDRRRIQGTDYDVRYQMDTRGRILHIDTPALLRIEYIYDSQDRVKKIQIQRRVIDPQTGQFPPKRMVVGGALYEPFGPLQRYNYGDGYSQIREYDSSYRMTRVLDRLLSSKLREINYGWTTRDNLASVSDVLVPAQSETYQYSAREFLNNADGDYGEIDYEYDAVGNRTRRTVTFPSSAVSLPYNYPTSSNRLQSIAPGSSDSRVMTYDAAGNITQDARSSANYNYTYNAANRLNSFSIGGTLQEEYLYNAMGQQVVRKLLPSGKTLHVVHDLDGNRLAEYEIDDATGVSTLLQEYIWFNGEAVGVVDGGTDDVFFVRTDHIGRPIFATDDTATKVWEATYLPFGGVHVTTGAAIDLRFPGQWFQSTSGLHQNWFRDYDPTTGRYLEADPLGLIDGASLYGYGMQNPVLNADPLGLLTFYWYGNWGGPGRVNGQTYRAPQRTRAGTIRKERGWTESHDFPREEEEGFVAPIDDRDACYYGHDVCIADCVHGKEDQCSKDTEMGVGNEGVCIANCDIKLSQCDIPFYEKILFYNIISKTR